MIIALVVMTIFSAVWFYLAAGMHGTFGIRTQRRLTLRVDKKVDRDLMRVIARYNSGELTLEESKYGKNLLFSKMVNMKGSSTVRYSEENFYVNIEHPDKYTFGRITNVPISSWSIRDSGLEGNGAISVAAFDDLMKIINESFPKDDEVAPKKRLFRKFTKEEVHLS